MTTAVAEELATALAREDTAEARGELDSDDRRTCWAHQSWFVDCVSSRLHANPVTGFNWCRSHNKAVQDCGCRPPSVNG